MSQSKPVQIRTNTAEGQRRRKNAHWILCCQQHLHEVLCESFGCLCHTLGGVFVRPKQPCTTSFSAVFVFIEHISLARDLWFMFLHVFFLPRAVRLRGSLLNVAYPFFNENIMKWWIWLRYHTDKLVASRSVMKMSINYGWWEFRTGKCQQWNAINQCAVVTHNIKSYII